MSEKVLNQLKGLRSLVRKYEDTLKKYKRIFEADGVVDAKEQAQLNQLNEGIQKIKANISEREEKLNFGGKVKNTVSGAKEGISDFLSRKDDIVDDSLINMEEEDTPTTDDSITDTPTTDSSTTDIPTTDSSTTDTPSSDEDKYAAIAETPAVKEFLNGIHKSEGGYVDDANDPGGKTKYGIAEKREWPAFAAMFGLDASNPSLIKDITKKQVDEYYIKTRFEQNGLDKINSTKVINAIFDQSILTPGIVKKNIKKSLVELDSNNKFPINNSEFSTAEIAAINDADDNKLVEKFVEYQNEYYDGLVKKNPAKFRKYINGWKNRTARLTGFSGSAEENDTSDTSSEADASSSENTFEVPSGWGLLQIAKEHGITVEELKAWNADKLKTYSNGSQGFDIGETIVVKGGSSSATTSTDDSTSSEGGGEEEVTEGGHVKPSWIREAEKHLGKKETATMVKDDPWVKLLFEELGAYDWAKTQTVSAANWCAAFVSYCFKKTGQSPLTGFDGMRAKTYADKYGKEVTRPVYGALAIFERGGAGHIGFVVGYNKVTKAIQLLGGNQGNAVTIKNETRTLIAYKVPSSWNIPEKNYLD
jgi:uncharacterized protein (TIGR02594 family)